MSALTVIDGALDLFERQGTHTRGALARDARGGKVKPTSPYAVQWDAIGATLKVCRTDRITGHDAVTATDLLQRAAEQLGYVSAMRCNDEMGKAGAVAMLKRARNLLDTQGPPTRARLEEGSIA